MKEQHSLNPASQGVRKLCDELNSRRRGDTSAGAAKATSTRSVNASADEEFWGAGGGSGVGKSSTSSGRNGQVRGKERKESVKGRAKGKVYKKPTAEEEDFWGGSTASGKGRSSTAKSTKNHSSSAPVSTPAPSAGRGRKGTSEGGGKIPPKTKAKGPATKSNAPPRVEQPVLSASASAGKPGSAEARGQRGKAEASASRAGSTKATPVTKSPEEKDQAATWSGVTCLCMGKKHDVITNCTTCGKIACVKEGGFGCSFCASALPVTGSEPRRSGDSKTRGGGEEELADVTQSAALKEALARKDRLLLFDRTSASRTRVLDDQGDYFTSHNWLSREEREKAEAEEKARQDDAAQRRGARRQVKLSIDIMGRRVIEAKDGEEPVVGHVEGGGGDERSGLVDEGVRYSASTATGVTSRNGASESAKGSGNQRPSLENTGLRGRAKEVYDVMRANLSKQGRREGRGSSTKRGGFRVAEQSRVSRWRVQHDIASDDVIRPNQMGLSGRISGGYEELDFEKFEPVEELATK